MKVLHDVVVTGAEGTVGGALVEMLVRQGYSVTAVARPESPLPHLPPEVPVVALEPEDGAGLARHLAGRDVVFHLARPVDEGAGRWRLREQQGLEVARAVVHGCRNAGVGRVVTLASPWLVGPAEGPDQPRGDEDLAAPSGPGRAERTIHTWMHRAARLTGLELVTVVPGTLLDPAAAPGEAAALVRDAVMGEPVPARGGISPVSPTDVARALVLAALRGTPGRRYLAGGENIPLTDLAELIREVSGQPVDEGTSWRVAEAGSGIVDWIRRLRGQAPTGDRFDGGWWYLDSRRARVELGWRGRPARAVVVDALAGLRGRIPEPLAEGLAARLEEERGVGAVPPLQVWLH